MHKRILLPSKNKNEILYISETIIDENFKTTKHAHPNIEILFFLEGSGYVITENEKIKVKKNDLMIINMESNHYECSNDNFRFYAIGLNHLKAFLKDSFSDNIIYISLDDQISNTIYNLYNMIYNESIEKKDNYMELINNYFESLKIIINRCISVNFYKINTKNKSAIVASLCQIIDNYFYLPIKIKDLAKRVSLSSSSICHLFKKEMGISIINYKINKQIEEAKNLILLTDMNMIEICNAVGLKDSSYFAKIFKKIVGQSPRDYKKYCTNL